VKYYFRIRAIDESGDGIENVDVRVIDDGNLLYASGYFNGSDLRTDDDGYTPWILGTNITYNGSNTPSENITNIELHDGLWTFSNNSRNVTIHSTYTEDFVGIPEFVHLIVPIIFTVCIVFIRQRRRRVN